MADEGYFYVPPEHQEGCYAHAFAVWHTAYEFTIDFAVTQLVPSEPDEPRSPYIADGRAVARVRIPPTLAFDLIQSINGTMSLYEAEWGEIAPPEPRREEEP